MAEDESTEIGDEKAFQYWQGQAAVNGHKYDHTIFEKAELNEDNLELNDSWLRASKIVYEMEHGAGSWAKKVTEQNWRVEQAEQELADWGMSYMGQFNYNLGVMGVEAAQLAAYANQEQKMAFIYMMDAYDHKDMSWSGVGRALFNMVWDPTTYIGIASFGVGTAVAQTAKITAKHGIRNAARVLIGQSAKETTAAGTREISAATVRETTKLGLKGKVVAGSITGAVEGGLWAGADDNVRQRVDITAGRAHEINWGRAGMAVGYGTVAGGVLAPVVPGAMKWIGNNTPVLPALRGARNAAYYYGSIVTESRHIKKLVTNKNEYFKHFLRPTKALVAAMEKGSSVRIMTLLKGDLAPEGGATFKSATKPVDDILDNIARSLYSLKRGSSKINDLANGLDDSATSLNAVVARFGGLSTLDSVTDLNKSILVSSSKLKELSETVTDATDPRDLIRAIAEEAKIVKETLDDTLTSGALTAAQHAEIERRLNTHIADASTELGSLTSPLDERNVRKAKRILDKLASRTENESTYVDNTFIKPARQEIKTALLREKNKLQTLSDTAGKSIKELEGHIDDATLTVAVLRSHIEEAPKRSTATIIRNTTAGKKAAGIAENFIDGLYTPGPTSSPKPTHTAGRGFDPLVSDTREYANQLQDEIALSDALNEIDSTLSALDTGDISDAVSKVGNLSNTLTREASETRNIATSTGHNINTLASRATATRTDLKAAQAEGMSTIHLTKSKGRVRSLNTPSDPHVHMRTEIEIGWIEKDFEPDIMFGRRAGYKAPDDTSVRNLELAWDLNADKQDVAKDNRAAAQVANDLYDLTKRGRFQDALYGLEHLAYTLGPRENLKKNMPKDADGNVIEGEKDWAHGIQKRFIKEYRDLLSANAAEIETLDPVTQQDFKDGVAVLEKLHEMNFKRMPRKTRTAARIYKDDSFDFRFSGDSQSDKDAGDTLIVDKMNRLEQEKRNFFIHKPFTAFWQYGIVDPIYEGWSAMKVKYFNGRASIAPWAVTSATGFMGYQLVSSAASTAEAKAAAERALEEQATGQTAVTAQQTSTPAAPSEEQESEETDPTAGRTETTGETDHDEENAAVLTDGGNAGTYAAPAGMGTGSTKQQDGKGRTATEEEAMTEEQKTLGEQLKKRLKALEKDVEANKAEIKKIKEYLLKVKKGEKLAETRQYLDLLDSIEGETQAEAENSGAEEPLSAKWGKFADDFNHTMVADRFKGDNKVGNMFTSAADVGWASIKEAFKTSTRYVGNAAKGKYGVEGEMAVLGGAGLVGGVVAYKALGRFIDKTPILNWPFIRHVLKAGIFVMGFLGVSSFAERFMSPQRAQSAGTTDHRVNDETQAEKAREMAKAKSENGKIKTGEKGAMPTKNDVTITVKPNGTVVFAGLKGEEIRLTEDQLKNLKNHMTGITINAGGGYQGNVVANHLIKELLQDGAIEGVKHDGSTAKPAGAPEPYMYRPGMSVEEHTIQ